MALLRTAGMHLYAWRGTIGIGPKGTLSSEKSSRAARTAVKRAIDEKQAEVLLARALELEPFHVPTLTALAFVILQRGGGGAAERAEELLDKAVKCAGPGGEESRATVENALFWHPMCLLILFVRLVVCCSTSGHKKKRQRDRHTPVKELYVTLYVHVRITRTAVRYL